MDKDLLEAKIKMVESILLAMKAGRCNIVGFDALSPDGCQVAMSELTINNITRVNNMTDIFKNMVLREFELKCIEELDILEDVGGYSMILPNGTDLEKDMGIRHVRRSSSSSKVCLIKSVNEKMLVLPFEFLRGATVTILKA